MIGTTTHQSWLFFLPLAKQASLLKDDLLDPMDQLLKDPELVGLVRTCLAGRRPASTRTGRTGIAPDCRFSKPRDPFLTSFAKPFPPSGPGFAKPFPPRLTAR